MNAIGYGEFYSRSHHAVLRFYDEAGNVIQTHALTADSSSRKAVSFHLLARRNDFRRRDAHPQSRLFSRHDPTLRRNRYPIGLSSDYRK
jgi:hypothetical protein